MLRTRHAVKNCRSDLSHVVTGAMMNMKHSEMTVGRVKAEVVEGKRSPVQLRPQKIRQVPWK